MLSSKFVKAMLLGVGMTLLTSVSAFASTEEGKTLEQGDVSIQTMAVDPNASVSSPAFIVSDDILKRQEEIDVYLFKTHYGELEQAGIKITHTAPMENYVEVGITPYTPENADYLIKALGGEKLKIVEGMEAIPLKMDIPENEGDKVYKTTSEAEDPRVYMTGVVDEAAPEAAPDEAVDLRGGEPAENERDVLYTATAVDAKSGAEESNTSALPLAGAAGGILLIGGSLLAMKKRRSAARS